MLVPHEKIWQTGWHDMPKPNYQFEKRRRELDKKAKKEEKRRKKLKSGRASAPTSNQGPGRASRT